MIWLSGWAKGKEKAALRRGERQSYILGGLPHQESVRVDLRGDLLIAQALARRP